MSMSAINIVANMLFAKGYRVIIDQYTTAGKVYFGFTKSGNRKSDAKWGIVCLDQTEGGKINDFEWANGGGISENKIWNNRANGTYTYQND
jgi:hypothetical protein